MDDITQEDPTTTKGGSNWPQGTNQSEAAVRRSDNDLVKSVAQRAKTKFAISMCYRAKTQMDYTTHPVGDYSSNRHSEWSDRHSQRKAQEENSKCSANSQISPEMLS